VVDIRRNHDRCNDNCVYGDIISFAEGVKSESGEGVENGVMRTEE
jgi:hypothetical protein